MNVRIIGDAPAAAVLAGVLAAEQQEVIWNPDADGDGRLKALKRRKEIRLNLPWGWVRTGAFRLSSSRLLKAGELGVVAFRTSEPLRGGAAEAQGAIGGRDRTLLVLNDGLGTGIAGTAVHRGLCLFDALEWDPGVVELTCTQPRLIVQAGAELGELQRCLKARSIAFQEVEDLSPYRNALQIRELLDLPVALCHSTLANFLSYPEGREIAESLLEEGLRLFSQQDLPLARLPDPDPRELLQRLKRKPQEFDKLRHFPDRGYGPALQSLLRGEAAAAGEPNRRILRRSSQTGIDPGWNWAITQKINRVIRVGFYRDPVELYNALR